MFKKFTLLCLLAAGARLTAFGNDSEPEDKKWEPALPGWRYDFPADHLIHPGFKTEWWYFTGNLRDDRGRAYGYELTFFRQGVLPPPTIASDAVNLRSRFVQNDFKFAHFAISDFSGKRFVYTQKTSRGAFGEAGFGAPPPDNRQATVLATRLAWLDNWSIEPQTDGSWRLKAQANDGQPMSIDLVVSTSKPPVIEGVDGVSQKSVGIGNASHYYSFTRLKTSGRLALGSETTPRPVNGESWFDHEWASNQLAPDQIGWDWFCFQFDDQTELMLYAMRRRDGTFDPASSGTLVHTDGTTEHLTRDEFELRSVKSWHSTKTGADYPSEWQVNVPSRVLAFTVRPQLDNQELVLPPISYWEGAIQVSGLKAGHPIMGAGYMELTGYVGELKGLQQSTDSASGLRSPMH